MRLLMLLTMFSFIRFKKNKLTATGEVNVVMDFNMINKKCKEILNLIFDIETNRCKDNMLVKYELFNIIEYMHTKCLEDLFSEECNQPNEFKDDNTLSVKEEFDKLSPQGKSIFNNYLKVCNHDEYTFEPFGNNGYRAIIPPLLSRRSESSKTYKIKNKYINFVFETLLKANISDIKRMSDATIIIICHQLNNGNIIRDNDNADAHDVINLINKYILSTDDNGMRVSVLFDTKISDALKTEIYILPKLKLDRLICDKNFEKQA